MKFLITGKNGQLGQEFCKYFLQHKSDYVAFSKDELDIADAIQLEKVIKDHMPDVIINCAAYNQVDKAEKDNKSAFKINSTAVENLALIAKKLKIKLVHYSSDYVFDGTKKEGPYIESDTTNPINEYGKSKLAGEIAIKKTFDNFLIFRVSWVYGKGQQNFIYKLLEWSKNKDVLQVADDEISVPTSTRTIVEISLKALEKKLTGLYHLTNNGSCSRYEWAKEILKIKNIEKKIMPISKEIFNLPAKRPEFSAMDSEKLEWEIKSWQDELSCISKTLDKQKIIRKILEILPQTKAIYLFGSYFSGDNNIKSDVDIALLFSHIDAKKIGNMYLSKLHLELEDMLNLDVDLVNLRSASTVMQNEIINSGEMIFVSDQYMVEEFEMLALSFYQKLNEERKEILKEISNSRKILD